MSAATEVQGSAPATESSPKQRSQYYYWHGHEKERAAVGDVAPKTAPQLVASSPLTADAQPKLSFAQTIEKYSWCNNAKSVSVYVDVDSVDQLAPEAVKVEFTKKTLSVTILKDNKSQELRLRLNKDIVAETSSFRFKPNQLVIKLMKEDENSTWFDLADAKHSFGDDDE